jgi:hypothetical protein
MHTLFEGKPGMLTFIKIGIVAFITLSVINLCLTIKINKAIIDKEKTV